SPGIRTRRWPERPVRPCGSSTRGAVRWTAEPRPSDSFAVAGTTVAKLLSMRGFWVMAVIGACLLGAGPAAAVDDESSTVPAQEIADLRAEVERLRARLDWLEAGQGALPRALHTFELPAKLEFAGEAVPLTRWDVAERLEREFLLAVGNPAQVVLWLKRSSRYFPYIERELARAGLPEDLKYVAVIESALLPGAYSHASALGIWQFIASTAKRYGLSVTTGWDERRN